jgi:AmmeMemoRadiSam system protein B
MSGQDCPRLRSGLAAVIDKSDPRFVIVWDQLRIATEPQRLSALEFMWLRLFDGKRTLRDIQAEAMRHLNGELISLDFFQALVERLDLALFLDGPRFQEHLSNPVREPSCVGCYPADPEALRRYLQQLFIGPGGSGLPSNVRPDGNLRAVLVPHIDYQRGGATYTWAFKEIFEHSNASIFVIVGTSHYSGQRFTLTRKNFKTPLGIVPTDQPYADRLVRHYGDGLFDDELAHLPEHSIELEVVFLQFVYEERSPFRIVPLVVGSFQDAVDRAENPRRVPDIQRMISALRQAESETSESVCYIISGDLAHLGPKFDDPDPVREPLLTFSKEQDQALLRHAAAIDMDSYFKLIAEEKDRRRICGLPPTFTVLEAALPRSGKLLDYDQYAHTSGFESVSFATVAFYR